MWLKGTDMNLNDDFMKLFLQAWTHINAGSDFKSWKDFWEGRWGMYWKKPLTSHVLYCRYGIGGA